MIADQREPFGAARQIIAGSLGDAAERHTDGLADQQFRTRAFAVGLAGIACVKLPAAVGAKAVDAVQIERRRAEIFDRGRVGFLVAKGGKIERDIVIDELSEIGEPRRDLGVVSRRIGRARGPSSRRRVPEAGRHRPPVARAAETSARTFPGRRARKACLEIAELDDGQLCHGQAGHSLPFPSLAPIRKNAARRGAPVSVVSSR